MLCEKYGILKVYAVPSARVTVFHFVCYFQSHDFRVREVELKFAISWKSMECGDIDIQLSIFFRRVEKELEQFLRTKQDRYVEFSDASHSSRWS